MIMLSDHHKVGKATTTMCCCCKEGDGEGVSVSEPEGERGGQSGSSLEQECGYMGTRGPYPCYSLHQHCVVTHAEEQEVKEW